MGLRESQQGHITRRTRQPKRLQAISHALFIPRGSNWYHCFSCNPSKATVLSLSLCYKAQFNSLAHLA